MKNWIIILTAAFLFFSGCQKDEAIIPMEELALAKTVRDCVQIGEEFVLLHNTSVMVVPDGFTLTFADVEEDSRCPTNADCVWEGRAIVKLHVQDRDQAYEVFLETPNSMNEHGQAVNLFGRTIKLLDLAPYPETEYPLTLKQYRMTMVVDELERLNEEV